DRHAEPDRDAIDLILHRAGVGVDIDAGYGRSFSHRSGGWQAWPACTPWRGKLRAKREAFPPARVDYSCLTKTTEIRGNPMDSKSPAQTYRVSAYNTSKLSENKIHDDAVARKFGFSGGLVPGVDVMAYMMHLPVEKWGRDFLERGLIE